MPTETVETYENGQLVETRTVQVSQETVNERTLRDRAEQAIAALEADSGTQAQRTQRLERAVAALIRLHLRRLDAT